MTGYRPSGQHEQAVLALAARSANGLGMSDVVYRPGRNEALYRLADRGLIVQRGIRWHAYEIEPGRFIPPPPMPPRYTPTGQLTRSTHP